MTVRIAEQQVVSEEDHVVSVRQEGDTVTVHWTCGDVRTFTAEGIREAVENARLTAEEFPGDWMEAQDANGERYAVVIVDGELYADTRSRPDYDGLSHVPWLSLRRAVNRAARDIEKRTGVPTPA